MNLTLMAAAALLLAAPGIAAQTTESQQATAGDATVAKKPKKVCRTVQVTGRMIASSVCHTADEWAAIDKADEENARKFTDRVNGQRNAAPFRGSDGQGGMSSGPF